MDLVRELLELYTAEALENPEEEADHAGKVGAAPAEVLLRALRLIGATGPAVDIRHAALSQVSAELFAALPPRQQNDVMQARNVSRKPFLPTMHSPCIFSTELSFNF